MLGTFISRDMRTNILARYAKHRLGYRRFGLQHVKMGRSLSRSKTIQSAAVLGLALFALFFGAGNLIFPPVIGLEGGTDWLVGYSSYFLADVGLALLGLAAMTKSGGKMEGVTGVIGKAASTILNCAIILCVGPLLAIPRTAATSFEMGSACLVPELSTDPLARAVFSIIFFAVVFAAALRPGKIVDRIGKILTPLLVIALAVLIVSGFINPAAQLQAPRVDNLLQEGVLNGYQTMDMVGALVFSLVVVKTIENKAAQEKISRTKLVLAACGVAAALLFMTYGGLAYLGATTGQLWGDAYMAGEINHAGLLSAISEAAVGSNGAAVLAAVVVLACLTTAIGLVSACSKFIVDLFKERLSYPLVTAGICVFSAFACNLGLTQIVSISAPILALVYPTTMFLVIMRLIPLPENTYRLACRFGAIASFAISICALFADTLGVQAFSIAHLLPLDNYGFGWFIPTLVTTLIGAAITQAHMKNVYEN